jgi:hypothetical protein
MEEVAAADTRLEAVTVYARGARVRRVTGIDVCPPQLRITGLPVAVIDDTVRISVEGPALATNVRTGIDAPREATAAEETSEVREAKRLAALAQAELARLQATLSRLSSSSILAADPTDDPPAPWAEIVNARRATLALRTERELALREQIAAARRAADDQRAKLEAIVDRDRRTGTARPAKQHELRKQIEIELAKTGDGPVTIHLEYLVAAARWAPSYVARIEGARASFEIRAVVAQASGEDWTGAKLSLSTAEPARFAQLPELAAQRIGRRQDEPARGGFRAPPAGAEALYADYLRHANATAYVAPATIIAPESVELDDFDGEVATGGRAQSFAEEVWDEESSAAKNAFSTPPQGRPMPMPMAPAAAKSHTLLGGVAKSLARDEVSRQRSSAPETKKSDGGGGQAPPPPAAPQPRLDYPNLVIANPDSPSRGRLVAAPRDAHSEEARIEAGRGQMKVEMLVLPPGCSAAWSHTYDYAYATDGTVDVEADGAWHSIAVTARPASVELRHVAVPREQADVFRIAAIANPFEGPLLPGPIDVYEGVGDPGSGRFLVTSAADYAPPGARVEIGLGVDAAIKIARNTEFREEATGMLRGSLRLHHAVTIDVDNVSAIPVQLEVRERMPVTREGEDDIEITPGRVEPAWESWKPDAVGPAAARLRGGHRWRVAVPAGQKVTLRAAYEIKISSKAELVGGNRRES